MNVKADPTTELMAGRSKREGWEEDPHERPGFNIHSVDYICFKCSWGQEGGPFHCACPFNKSMVLQDPAEWG